MAFRISRQALADIEAIEKYLSARSPSAAVAVLDALLSTFEALLANPAMGESREDLHRGIRMFIAAKPAHNYVVFYYPFRNGIEISNVIHASRDWESIVVRTDS